MNDEIITSYLLGKKAGGGGTPPVYQDKEVSITQNGTSTITKDSGYDALNSVELTVNVPQPTGKITITQNGTNIDVSSYATADVSVGGSAPNSIEDFQASYKKLIDDIKTYTTTTEINNRNAYTENSITLYSPNAAFKYYFIVEKSNQKYAVVWHVSIYAELFVTSSSKYLKESNIRIAQSQISKTGNISYGSIVYNDDIENCYYSNDYDTYEEVITALQNNTITYNTSQERPSLNNNQNPILYSNASILKTTSGTYTRETYTGAGVISHDETIQVIS